MLPVFFRAPPERFQSRQGVQGRRCEIIGVFVYPGKPSGEDGFLFYVEIVREADRKGGVVAMRLDKYLKVSRLIKRRTVANEACDAGKVLVNGKPARASYDVKEGDILEIAMGARIIRAEVVSVQEYAAKNDAALLRRIP